MNRCGEVQNFQMEHKTLKDLGVYLTKVRTRVLADEKKKQQPKSEII